MRVLTVLVMVWVLTWGSGTETQQTLATPIREVARLGEPVQIPIWVQAAMLGRPSNVTPAALQLAQTFCPFSIGVTWHPSGSEFGCRGRVYDARTGRELWHHKMGQRHWEERDEGGLPLERTEVGGRIHWHPSGHTFIAILNNFDGGSAAYYDFALFEARTDRLLRVLENSAIHSETSYRYDQLAWSADGTRVTNGYAVWELRTGRLISTGGPYRVRNDVYLDQYKLDLAFADEDRHICVWPTPEGEDSHFPGTLTCWHADTGKQVFAHIFENRSTWVRRVGNTLQAWTGTQQLTFDDADGRLLHSEVNQTAVVEGDLAWSPDGTRLLAVSSAPNAWPMRLWHMDGLPAGEQPALLWTVNSDRAATVAGVKASNTAGASVTWQPDGHTFVTQTGWHLSFARRENRVDVWAAATGQLIAQPYYDYNCGLGCEGDDQSIDQGTASPDLRWLAVRTRPLPYAPPFSPLQFVERGSGRVVAQIRPGLAEVVWNPTGTHFAAYNAYEPVQIWQFSPGMRRVSVLPTTVDRLQSVTWSADGRFIAGANRWYTPPSLWLHDTHTQHTWQVPKAARQYSVQTTWAPDGHTLAVMFDGEILFYHALDRRWLTASVTQDARLLSPGYIGNGAMAWSPDGAWLAVVYADGTIGIWDVRALNVVPGV